MFFKKVKNTISLHTVLDVSPLGRGTRAEAEVMIHRGEEKPKRMWWEKKDCYI